MSLRGDKYETVEEVKFRLENTVVLYDEEPVYITRVNAVEPGDDVNPGEVSKVYFQPLPWRGAAKNDLFIRFDPAVQNPAPKAPDRRATRKFLSSRKFDLTPFKMGYFNEGGQATFVSRAPVRQNQQGLSARTALFSDIKGRKSLNIGWNQLINSQGFVDMVHGKYPSLEEAKELINNENHTSVAVSRSFAFFIDHDLESMFLMHKGTKCGFCSTDDNGVKVPNKFHFLREEMEEARIPIQ